MSLLQNMGIAPMNTETGLQTLYKALQYGGEQVVVFEGRTEQIKHNLFSEKNSDIYGEDANSKALPPSKEIEEASLVPADLLTEKTIRYLKKEVSSVIRLSADRIETDSPMEKYGIDSIVSMQLVNKLEKTFGSLPKTLFFEYQNIKELSEFFMDSYREKLLSILEIDNTSVSKPLKQENGTVSGDTMKLPYKSLRRTRFATGLNVKDRNKTPNAMDIAIIGVAGRYPQAADLEEFWDNLKEGRDCITEIPEDRWNHSLYFDEDKNKQGKTYSKWGGFIEGVDRFDPLFFNISPVRQK
jgi:acyl carrier protein